jgi:hypothetical protein
VSIRIQMDVTEGEKQMILALRRAALTVTPYNGSAALQAAMTGATPAPASRCRAMGRGDLQCVKEGGHGQRHRYGPKSANPTAGHRVPTRSWVKTTSFVKESGSRKYKIEIGYPCKVEGQRGLWKVIGIEQGSADVNRGKINVEVTNDRTGHSRVFPADKIQYKRPKKIL